MRLLARQPNGEFCLTRRFLSDPTFPYAILSHTWGDESQEVTYEDLLEGTGRNKEGYEKIRFCAEQAAKDGLQYLWVDTCCIKKTSDAELSSSINAMFRWYQRATKCYVFLADVLADEGKRGDDTMKRWEWAFRESRWFTRCWTLQELLAPASVEFFSSNGMRLGDRVSLKDQIHEVTGIPLQALGGRPLGMFSVSERNSWAAKRVSTVEEDAAYCLMGIFDISMSSRYGEGREKAFQRLNNKIKKGAATTANNEKVDENRNAGRDTIDAILRWLDSPDHAINYENALKQRQVGTGLWFLQHKSYLEWIAGKSNFLWLYGIPGCGKSILSSTILEDLLGRTEQDTGSTVVYFYFDFNDPQKRRADLMVRSILAQLLRKCDGVPAAVAALFSSCENGRRQPPLGAYVDVLRRIIIEIPRVFLVLDALDECDSRKVLLEVITTISSWEVNNLHILFTSRKERDIQDIMEQIVRSENMVPLQSDQVDPDIRAYIVERLSKDKSLEKWHRDNEVEEEIKSVLMKGAQGMFRWAACQLDALARCRNRAQLRKSLSSLPPTLDETYERILCAIPEEDAEYALRLLRWLVFSERPLLLKEIVEILAFNPEREVPFDRDEILEDPLEVLDICSSLVRTTTVSAKESDKDSNKEYSDQHNTTGQAVVLSHYSVQEYLTSQRCINGQASQYAIDEAVCHTLISESCLSSLLLSFSKESREDIGKLTLSDYSARFWASHAEKGQKNARWTRRTATFCSDSRALVQWIEKYNPGEVLDVSNKMIPIESVPQGLYFISLVGFVEVAVQLIERYNHDVNAQGGICGNALQAASRSGHKTLVDLLISKGADVNAQGGVCGNALQAASDRGYLEIVELLISKGADVNAQNGAQDNALQAASYNGHSEIVELLLSKGADVNARGVFHANALHAASEMGHKNIVEMLLSKGIEVNAQGGNTGNALQAASHGGHEGVIELLISNGADVNARGGHFGNALQAASANGHKTIVNLLISRGANVNAQGWGWYGKEGKGWHGNVGGGWYGNEGGGFYGNALQAAAQGGYSEIAELLLIKGADVHAQGGLFGDALQAASHRGHEGLVELLISNGADVNARGGHFDNALQAASERGHLDVVELLISKGADVNAQGERRCSRALQAASYNGHKTLVDLLISKGADVNAQGGDWGNALQAASCGESKTIVELLICEGADINAQGGKYYNNALEAASHTGCLEIVEVLISKGADVNAQGRGCHNNALQAASGRGHREIVELLMSNGADVNAPGGDLYGSALQAASEGGHLEVVELLINKGADVNAQGNEQCGNALQAASNSGHKKIIAILLEHGAVPA